MVISPVRGVSSPTFRLQSAQTCLIEAGIGTRGESQSKPGINMVDPEPCKELRRRPQLFPAGIVPELLTFIYPGFDCSSGGEGVVVHFAISHPCRQSVSLDGAASPPRSSSREDSTILVEEPSPKKVGKRAPSWGT